MTTPDHQRHMGRWILADCVERTNADVPRLKVISIGDVELPGLAARTVLDTIANKVLAPRMRTAATDRREQRGVPAQAHGLDLVTWVRPIFGAFTGNVLGVLGCYQQVGAEFGEPPSIGTHEWYGSAPGPDQHVTGFWSREIFVNYGLPVPSDVGRVTSGWEAPTMIGTLTAPAYRPAMAQTFQKFFAEDTERLRIFYYKMIDQTTGEYHSVRLASRRDFSTEIDDTGLDRTADARTRGMSSIVSPAAMAKATSPSWTTLEAAFDLSSDALCGIDTSYLTMFHASEQFSRLGVAMPLERHLATMCHPGDFARLRAFLKQTERPHARQEHEIRAVRWRLTTGNWLALDMAARALGKPDDHPHIVLCRVVPT